VTRIVGAKSKATLLRELGYHIRYGQWAQRLSRGLSSRQGCRFVRGLARVKR
jgi:hypothetical protein